MSPVTDPVFALADHLLLAGLVLDVLQCGSMCAHAEDYREISRDVSAELSLLDTPTLRSLRQRSPESFDTIIENLLHERGEAAWAIDVWAQLGAEVAWSRFTSRSRP